MIGWLFEKLTGPWGYVLAGINGAVIAGGVAWEARGLLDAKQVLTANLAVVQAARVAETNRADANAATVQAVTKSVNQALGENAYLTGQAVKRYAATVALTQRLGHVPKTVACVGSPAIRELLRTPAVGKAASGSPN